MQFLPISLKRPGNCKENANDEVNFSLCTTSGIDEKKEIEMSEADKKLSVARAELSTLIARQAPIVGNFSTLIEGVTLYRRVAPTAPVSGFYAPSMGFIAQGLKRVTLGEQTYYCDAQCYLLTAVDL